MFDAISMKMMQQDSSLFIANLNGTSVLISKDMCQNVAKRLSPFSLKVQDKHMSINPTGYLYTVQNSRYCYVGIQQNSEDNQTQITLGQIFLRNFYTVLDYKNNLILAGVNANSINDSSMDIEAQDNNP